MTDGMLFRETLVDPLLTRYSVIMVGSDVLFALFSYYSFNRSTKLTNGVCIPISFLAC